ncbi:hypothetical protein L210DRAFT_879263 [Boletus edulis BED1]|uniref:Uncharacterized protein n=1 Tax=Boletus edulis BED1 TaxID=1328754 RepID=A0AAD4BCH2_BOLED|nr:hypothetical protein L210DRAFT_879263 [Boletus edulis BED1]
MASADQPEFSASDSLYVRPTDSLPDSDPAANLSVSPLHRRSTAPQSISAQSTSSTVPGTPGADRLSLSLLSIGQSPLPHQPRVPLRGTPSAVGAIRARNSIHALSYTGTPLRNALLEPASRSSTISTHMAASVLGKRLRVRTQYINDTSDPEREEFERQEALLVVEVARVQLAVRRSEKDLVRAQLDETAVLDTLHKCRLAEMERRFDMAESHLGSIRNSIRTNGGILCERSLHKHRRQDSTSSIIIDHDPGTCLNRNHSVLVLQSRYMQIEDHPRPGSRCSRPLSCCCHSEFIPRSVTQL